MKICKDDYEKGGEFEGIKLKDKDLNILEQAKIDRKNVTKAPRLGGKRRQGVPWSMPREIWMMILWPDYYSVAKPQRGGIGYDIKMAAKSEKTQVRLLTLFYHVRRAQATPLESSRTFAWQLPKMQQQTDRRVCDWCMAFAPFGALGTKPH